MIYIMTHGEYSDFMIQTVLYNEKKYDIEGLKKLWLEIVVFSEIGHRPKERFDEWYELCAKKMREVEKNYKVSSMDWAFIKYLIDEVGFKEVEEGKGYEVCDTYSQAYASMFNEVVK